MPIVFIANQDPLVRYLDTRYTTLAYVTQGTNSLPEVYLEQAAGVLIRSKETDLLCMIGDPLAQSIVLAVWLQIHPVASLLFPSQNGTRDCTLRKSEVHMYIEQMRDIYTRRK